MFGADRKKLVMCQACRGLIEPRLKTCPLCGRESVPPLPARIVESASSSHFISLLLLSINIVLFVLMAFAESKSGGGGASFINSATEPVLTNFGVRRPDLIAQGQWWRLVTPNFLHLGVMHLMFNSLALYQIGPLAEELYGSQKFLFIYLGTGIISNIASFVFGIRGAGASGAIFGLIGLLVVYGYRLGGAGGRGLAKQMLIWAGAGMIYGFILHADNVAHAGGFIAGAAFGLLLAPSAPSTHRDAIVWNGAAIACVLLIVASFACVGAAYGKTASPDDVKTFFGTFKQLEGDLSRSYITRNTSNTDVIANAKLLRSEISDIKRVRPIDNESEDIKQRLVALATKRAVELESLDANATTVPQMSFEERAAIEQIVQSFNTWINSGVLEKYGLELKSK